MNTLKSMTGIVVAVTVAAGSGCAGDPTGPSNQVRIFFTGTVSLVEDHGLPDLDGRIAVGQTVVGFYMYDMRAVDGDTTTTFGVYRHTTQPYGISVTVNGLTFETDPTNVDFSVILGDNSLGRDSYFLGSENNRVRNGGLKVGFITWRLRDTTETALSSTVLPGSAPDLADWQSNVLQVGGRFVDQGYMVQVHVTQVRSFF